MSGRSRRRGGKPMSSKRMKARKRFSTTAAQPRVVPQTHEPISRPSMPVSSAKVPVAAAKQASVRYAYVATELRTIAILAGIILIILVVLALVLS